MMQGEAFGLAMQQALNELATHLGDGAFRTNFREQDPREVAHEAGINTHVIPEDLFPVLAAMSDEELAMISSIHEKLGEVGFPDIRVAIFF